jgi:hypothetical protein
MLYLLNKIIPNMLGLIGSSNGRPRYFTGKEETHRPQPIIPASLSTCSTFPTRTNSKLAKLIFKPEATSKMN